MSLYFIVVGIEDKHALDKLVAERVELAGASIERQYLTGDYLVKAEDKELLYEAFSDLEFVVVEEVGEVKAI